MCRTSWPLTELLLTDGDDDDDTMMTMTVIVMDTMAIKGVGRNVDKRMMIIISVDCDDGGGGDCECCDDGEGDRD